LLWIKIPFLLEEETRSADLLGIGFMHQIFGLEPFSMPSSLAALGEFKRKQRGGVGQKDAAAAAPDRGCAL
jgi:hypothetical protein